MYGKEINNIPRSREITLHSINQLVQFNSHQFDLPKLILPIYTQ